MLMVGRPQNPAILGCKLIKDLEIPSQHKALSFRIEDPPSSSENERLLRDLLHQNDVLHDTSPYVGMGTGLHISVAEEESLEMCEARQGCGMSIVHCRAKV